MTILLDDEDALFDSGSFTLVHNDTVYHVDPTIFFNFSRKFASLFQYVTKNPYVDEKGQTKPQYMSVNDEFTENAFAAYVEACQMKPIAPSGIILVDILVIAEDWDSPTLIAKIENLLSTVVPPNELIRLFINILKNNLHSERIENIITMNLPRFLEAPLFSSLPFAVIERMITGYPGKLTPSQLIKLCYAASVQGGMESMKFVKRYSFDHMKLDLVNDLVVTFGQCPYRKLKDFFYAMGRLLEQLTTPLNNHKDFKGVWTNADKGTGDDAYLFYKQVQAKKLTSTGRHSATEEAFLKTAANRGNAQAQYEYGKVLLEKAKTEIQEDTAVEYLIQAAAKGVKEAIPLLEPYFSLSMIDEEQHSFIYQNLALQIVLLNMNKENIESTRHSIIALNFHENESKLLILAQYIIKAVTSRQRSVELYADLIGFLAQQPNYESLKQNIFSLIILSLFDKNPDRLQFVNLRFLYICFRRNIFLPSEIEGPLMDFVKLNAPIFVKTTLEVYYWFAPIVEKSNPEVSTFIFMKALMIEKGEYGMFDDRMYEFRENVRRMRESQWNGFYELRDKEFYPDPIMHALIYDDLATFKKYAEEPDFNLNAKVLNWIVDLAVPGEEAPWDKEFTLIQFAAMQGSRSIFLYLLRRGAEFLESNNSISATCAACGQDKFILGFITNIKESIREEMFRMAGKFNNIYLMILLLQAPLNVNSADSRGSTSLHFATRNQNNGIVNLLCHTKGVDVNAQTEDGVTPFHYAVFSGKLLTAQILAEAPGVDVNCTDKHGSTPLHYAVWNNDITLVKYLLTLPDIDVNAQAKLQRTPLHEAAKCGFLDIVRILVKAKDIDLNLEDQSHRTPLRLAMKRHQVDVVQFLNTVDGVERVTTTIPPNDSSSVGSEAAKNDFLHDPY